MTSLRKKTLVRLETMGAKITSSETLIEGLGRFRDIEVGPRGELYVLVEVLRPTPPERGRYDGSHLLRLTPGSP